MTVVRVSEPLLDVADLTVAFGDKVVVDHVTFTIERGGRLAIIGESGSGKTLTALAVIGLAPDNATITGRVTFDGQQLLGRSDGELSKLHGPRIAMVFQNPQSSLNPLMRVGKQIAEPLRRHRGMDRDTARRAAVELCAPRRAARPERAARAYPHQLSGGQRQRIGIAIALACRPALLIADEPTTALDVTVQAEVLALLAELIAAEGTTLLFITHDIALVPLVADDLMVMRHGRIVEAGPVARSSSGPATRTPSSCSPRPSAPRCPPTRAGGRRDGVARRHRHPPRAQLSPHVAVGPRAEREALGGVDLAGRGRGAGRHRRRVGLGQVDAGAHPARPRPGDVGAGRVRRQGGAPRAPGDVALVPARRADRLPGPAQLARPTVHRRRHRA